MTNEPAEHERLPDADRHERGDQRVSPRVAVQISLGVHALLAIALFRMVTEYAGQPDPPLRIVARAAAPRDAATPSFVTTPPSTADLAKDLPHPTSRVEPLPHQAISFAGSDLLPIQPSAPGSRRATAPAVLPTTSVVVPTEKGVTTAPSVDPHILSPSDAEFGRTDTLRDMPLRIASRPIYGTREQRPLGLAVVPAARTESPGREPADAFAHRRFNLRTPKENQSAIDRGLEFLARVQLDDGRWRFDDLRGSVDPDAETVSIRADAAATGLALLAFLGAGYDHSDGRYQATVADGLAFLERTQQATGELYVDSGLPSGPVTRYYGHGIATLALAEALGMTGDRRLRAPAQRAVDYLIATQNPDKGGWRYAPGVNTDLSVTAWQLAALRSARRAGLEVSGQSLDDIARCLASCRDNGDHPGLYCYNPWASPDDPLTRHGRLPSTVMTSVGLLMELQLGAASDDPRLRPAAEHLLANLPRADAAAASAPVGTLANPQRDTYYWYYGTQAMFYLESDYWQAWAQQLEPLLISSQADHGLLAGSWDPVRPTPDKWSAYGGRLYVTAMNLLSLEIYNRQLPPENETLPRIAERPAE